MSNATPTILAVQAVIATSATQHHRLVQVRAATKEIQRNLPAKVVIVTRMKRHCHVAKDAVVPNMISRADYAVAQRNVLKSMDVVFLGRSLNAWFASLVCCSTTLT